MSAYLREFEGEKKTKMHVCEFVFFVETDSESPHEIKRLAIEEVKEKISNGTFDFNHCRVYINSIGPSVLI